MFISNSEIQLNRIAQPNLKSSEQNYFLYHTRNQSVLQVECFGYWRIAKSSVLKSSITNKDSQQWDTSVCQSKGISKLRDTFSCSILKQCEFFFLSIHHQLCNRSVFLMRGSVSIPSSRTAQPQYEMSFSWHQPSTPFSPHFGQAGNNGSARRTEEPRCCLKRFCLPAFFQREIGYADRMYFPLGTILSFRQGFSLCQPDGAVSKYPHNPA